ncbi:thiamine/thiamine pyrophosphate ABC transporter permease ThiP [Parasulfitobacter algicola]|uniref:Thiamine/thiamine pyrophosphate ABC transporter permease ThiP n=1 Tax=Parasulfitobacter algicola TaxID=2614809 RepID=A0ABX2IN20_9RHOB|nr:thiamine/thiamine pyrophosphate ABC transporter permease ThiP [Sulfitobacter algicola]NSX54274.1 thiamine/thiamine pyrophosphate ABC transporter permease ThiP [Sulfitobacter algicola]
MAARASLTIRLFGGAAIAVLLTLSLGTLIAVLLRAEAISGFGRPEWAAVRFTLMQATLSALISVSLAIPLARALARRQFPGRSALITLLGAPFILPVIVAILGLVAIFGRNGVISNILGFPLDIYGLQGILLAHVFFNLPLATRLILQGWLAIPSERFRLAASLGFTSGNVARTIERPMLIEIVPGAFLVIFLICLTSFAVALALGGGPAATTVELAIYQAFRFDFDLSKAALLASAQFVICAIAGIIALRLSIPQVAGGELDRTLDRWDAKSPFLRLQDGVIIILSAVFLLVPLSAVVLRGLPGVLEMPVSVWQAALRSIFVTVIATTVCMAMSLSLAFFVQNIKRGKIWVEGVSLLAIAASPLVMGTGLFLILFPMMDPSRAMLFITALVNAAMALPFALRALVPALRQIEGTYGKLADSLGMHGFTRLRYLYLPRLRRPLGFSAGLIAALAMGDLGVITLFSDPNRATLPLEMYRLMASYRLEAASGAALLLLMFSLSVFWIFDKGGRVNADV